MPEVASLIVEVDTGPMKKAAADASNMREAMRGAANSTQTLSQGSKAATSSVQGLKQATEGTRANIDKMAASMKGVGDSAGSMAGRMKTANDNAKSFRFSMAGLGTSFGGVSIQADGVNKKFEELSGKLNSAKAGMIALGAAITARFLGSAAGVADNVKRLEIQLTTLTGTSGGAAEAYDYLYTTSQRLSVGTDALAKSYIKLLPLVQSNLLTTGQARSILEGFGNVAAATGASTGQLEQALFGLSQGLSSGTLKAEELNQIMEPLPGLMQKLDKAAGLPAGGFRKLTNEGKITADTLRTVLIAALKDYEGAAERNSGTISASLVRLGNSWKQLKATIAEPLVPAFAFVIEQVNRLVSLVEGAISRLKKAAFNVGFQSVRDDGQSFFDRVKGLGKAAIAGLKGQQYGNAAAPDSSGTSQDEMDALKARLKADYDAIGKKKEKSPKQKKEKEDNEKVKASYEDLIAPIKQNILLLSQSKDVSEVLSKALNIRNQAQQQGIKLTQQQTQEISALLQKEQGLQAIGDVYEKFLKSNSAQAEKARSAARNEEYDKIKRMIPTAEELERGGQFIGLVDSLRDRMEELMAVTKPGKITVDVLSSMKQGLDAFAKTDVQQAAESIKNSMKGAFSAMEDALVEFVKTGKVNMGDFAGSVIADLSRIAIRQTITAPLANAFSSILGNINVGGLGTAIGGALGLSGSAATAGGGSGYIVGGGLQGYAGGGSFTVGGGGSGAVDSQVVAFRATPGERVTIETPGQQGRRGDGGRPVNVTVNISTPNSQSFMQSRSQVQNSIYTAVRAGAKNA